MSHNKFKQVTSKLLQKFLSVDEIHDKKIKVPKNVLIIRQHNQFGDMLASVSLFRAIKETYPNAKITLLASEENFFAVENNPLIDRIFVFKKGDLINPFYLFKLKKILKGNYDLAIVPVTVAISVTSCILASLSDAEFKIGPKSLNFKKNEVDFLFHYRIDLNWKKCPDSYVSDFILDILRPFGIKTKNYSSIFEYDNYDIDYVNNFLQSINYNNNEILMGFHVGAGKPQNRWSLENFIRLINLLTEKRVTKIYFTGSSADNVELDFIKRYFPKSGYFIDKKISQLAALIDRSDLFITNDTGVMHVAGTTKVPQISLFGPTNPFNWAPVGVNKFFIRKSEIMNDISVEDVFYLSNYILDKNKIIN
ncbi:MAG: glycosyltransferase family 9 protein [Ignavibacteria bacterium]|nr:glycosyltransferase family 9 protein [Ignavibacteria bacterium]